MFHKVVKCTYPGGTADRVYYITFQAEAKEEGKETALKTFQTHVIQYRDKAKKPDVIEFVIKS